MALTVLQEVEQAGLQILLAESQANEATLVAWFNAGGTEVQSLLKGLFAKIPSIGGIVGIAATPIVASVETGIEAYVATLLTKYSGQGLYNMYIAGIQHLLTLV